MRAAETGKGKKDKSGQDEKAAADAAEEKRRIDGLIEQMSRVETKGVAEFGSIVDVDGISRFAREFDDAKNADPAEDVDQQQQQVRNHPWEEVGRGRSGAGVPHSKLWPCPLKRSPGPCPLLLRTRAPCYVESLTYCVALVCLLTTEGRWRSVPPSRGRVAGEADRGPGAVRTRNTVERRGAAGADPFLCVRAARCGRRLAEVRSVYDKLAEEVARYQAAVAKAIKYNKRVLAEMEKLKELETEEVRNESGNAPSVRALLTRARPGEVRCRGMTEQADLEDSARAPGHDQDAGTPGGRVQGQLQAPAGGPQGAHPAPGKPRVRSRTGVGRGAPVWVSERACGGVRWQGRHGRRGPATNPANRRAVRRGRGQAAKSAQAPLQEEARTFDRRTLGFPRARAAPAPAPCPFLLTPNHAIRARASQEIAGVQRQLDEIPSRTELTQYQKRFLELYNLVASKLSETRQFYGLYNILDATKLYLTREVTLLNSIFDNFEKAKATKNNQEKFLDTLETMLKSVRDLLAKARFSYRPPQAAA